MKKSFEIPFILRTNNGGDGSVIGGASGGQGDPTTSAMSFAQWAASDFWQDWDEHNIGYADPDEYRAWWDANEFSEDLWEELNGTPYPSVPEEP